MIGSLRSRILCAPLSWGTRVVSPLQPLAGLGMPMRTGGFATAQRSGGGGERKSPGRQNRSPSARSKDKGANTDKKRRYFFDPAQRAALTRRNAESEAATLEQKKLDKAAEDLLKRSREADAMYQLRMAAKGGHAFSQQYLGLLYVTGEDKTVGTDENLARKWLQRAAEQGLVQSQYFVGRMCEKHYAGMAPNMKDAVRWYEKASSQGFKQAMVRLAQILEEGAEGIEPDVPRSRQLLEQAAQGQEGGEPGHPDAQVMLGAMLLEGIGGDKDEARARQLFESAAETQHTTALFSYAAMLRDGMGGPPDLEKARTLFERAAKEGHEDAQRILAHMLREGEGGPQDTAAAARWEAAAEQAGQVQADDDQRPDLSMIDFDQIDEEFEEEVINASTSTRDTLDEDEVKADAHSAADSADNDVHLLPGKPERGPEPPAAPQRGRKPSPRREQRSEKVRVKAAQQGGDDSRKVVSSSVQRSATGTPVGPPQLGPDGLPLRKNARKRALRQAAKDERKSPKAKTPQRAR